MSHDPTEHVQEEIHHTAAHGAGPKWIIAAALTAAFLAALAAVTSSLATKHLTESTLTRIEANDNWNFFQAKSIKSSIIDSRSMAYDMAEPNAREAARKQQEEDLAKKKEYATPVKEDSKEKPKGLLGIQAKAEGLEEISKVHLRTHETYEMAATMFHIAIAIVAIAVVAKRKEFWFLSMLGGVAGLLYFGSAAMHAPGAEHGAAGDAHDVGHVAAGTHPAEGGYVKSGGEHH